MHGELCSNDVVQTYHKAPTATKARWLELRSRKHVWAWCRRAFVAIEKNDEQNSTFSTTDSMNPEGWPRITRISADVFGSGSRMCPPDLVGCFRVLRRVGLTSRHRDFVTVLGAQLDVVLTRFWLRPHSRVRVVHMLVAGSLLRLKEKVFPRCS